MITMEDVQESVMKVDATDFVISFNRKPPEPQFWNPEDPASLEMTIHNTWLMYIKDSDEEGARKAYWDIAQNHDMYTCSLCVEDRHNVWKEYWWGDGSEPSDEEMKIKGPMIEQHEFDEDCRICQDQREKESKDLTCHEAWMEVRKGGEIAYYAYGEWSSQHDESDCSICEKTRSVHKVWEECKKEGMIYFGTHDEDACILCERNKQVDELVNQIMDAIELPTKDTSSFTVTGIDYSSEQDSIVIADSSADRLFSFKTLTPGDGICISDISTTCEISFDPGSYRDIEGKTGTDGQVLMSNGNGWVWADIPKNDAPSRDMEEWDIFFEKDLMWLLEDIESLYHQKKIMTFRKKIEHRLETLWSMRKNRYVEGLTEGQVIAYERTDDAIRFLLDLATKLDRIQQEEGIEDSVTHVLDMRR